jgi:tetratricopeptide (TPR) repeat protein
VAAGALAVGAALNGPPEPQPPARAQPSGEAAELYLAASYELERRTPQSLDRARELFGRTVAQDPGYAQAYAGLAGTYLLMREFSAIPEAEAYPRAREAAERAVALDPRLADAHAALGFVTFYWTRDWPRGLASLERAIALDPASARARHWYATALLHTGRARDALAAIEEAQRRGPGSRSIMADKGIILFHAGRADEAVALLRQMAADEPDFSSPHSYLAAIALAQGDYAGYLAETAAAARIRGNAGQLKLAKEAERALRRGGAKAMLAAMLDQETARRRAGQGSDYAIARLRVALGDREGGLRLLESAYRRGEHELVGMRLEPMLAPLRGEAGFERLAQRVGRPTPERRPA